MINLYSYLIFENDIQSISSMLASLNDISDLVDAIDSLDDKLGYSKDGRKLRIVNNILNNLINDPDISHWIDSADKSEYELRLILKSKLNPREARYVDEICSRMLEIGNNSGTSRINNIVIELITDPDIDKWYKDDGDMMDLLRVLSSKLKGSDMNHIQQIAQNIYDICGK